MYGAQSKVRLPEYHKKLLRTPRLPDTPDLGPDMPHFQDRIGRPINFNEPTHFPRVPGPGGAGGGGGAAGGGGATGGGAGGAAGGGGAGAVRRPAGAAGDPAAGVGGGVRGRVPAAAAAAAGRGVCGQGFPPIHACHE